MSKISDKVEELLLLTYPGYTIYPEHYVKYMGQGLYFDYFIKELNLFVEVQGEQHYEHVEFFHTTKKEFYASQRRDYLKQEYAKENGFAIAYVNKKNLPKTSLELQQLINKGFENIEDTII